MRHVYSLFLLALLAAVPASAQITVASSGFWSDPTTWSTGAVPTAADDVVVLDSTVTIDIPLADGGAEARNITVSGEGTLRTNRGFEDNIPVALTVFGDLVIVGPDAEFLPLSNQNDDGGFGEVYHSLTVHGDIDNSTGGTFDMRRGSTSSTPATASFIDLTFAGSEDATMTLGDYNSNDNQLFRVNVAKEGGATISLGNDATVDNNSRAVFTLVSGYMDTGDFRFTLISNNSQVVQGGSPASYVLGEFARGLPKGDISSQASRGFPVGDADGYRPVNILVTDRPSDDQFMGVRAVPMDADDGSTLMGGLMEVSPVRYYDIEWYFFDSADPITIDAVEPSYGVGDGVPESSSDFVVAGSLDDRATWMNLDGFDADGATPHVTTLAAPPTFIRSRQLPMAGEPDAWTFDFTVQGTEVVGTVYQAAIGTTDMFVTVASEATPVVGAFELATAPNPVAGSTEVSFELPTAQAVSVEVFDMLGRRVATLAQGDLAAGPHAMTWDASKTAPGQYVVRLQAGGQAALRTMTVVR